MSALTLPMATLPATPPEVLQKIAELERVNGRAAVVTDHLIHGGMYARTMLMPEGMVLTGALMKRATVVIVTGSAAVLAGTEWLELEGYNVIPASAGRKQVFVSRTPVLITMLFPTQARTVAEAEAEFTDEAEHLLSRQGNVNRVVVTGE